MLDRRRRKENGRDLTLGGHRFVYSLSRHRNARMGLPTLSYCYGTGSYFSAA